MVPRKNRFHGYGSLKRVYQGGKTIRGPLFGLKTSPNPHRQSYRLAVVVSRKVEKSAVARNRMRRRLYAAVRQLEDEIAGPHDIVLTVFSKTLLEASPKDLTSQVEEQLKAAGILAKSHHS